LPDKFTSKSRSFDRNSYGEKDRELPKAAKGFFLVQGIAVERQGLLFVPVFCVTSAGTAARI
jgi:hypothetical protein